MPNIKSAKKRVLVNDKKTEQNKNIRSAVKTEMKKIEAMLRDNKIEEAKAYLPEVFKAIDMACSKNILHANNASNKKAKLAKKIDAAVKASAPAEVAPAVEVAAPAATEVVEAPKKTRKPRAKKAEAAE